MKADKNNKKIYIELKNDYQLNLLHGILVEEEKKVNEIEALLPKTSTNWANTKKSFNEVKRLRRTLTVMDDSNDYFGVFERIEEYGLDEIKNED